VSTKTRIIAICKTKTDIKIKITAAKRTKTRTITNEKKKTKNLVDYNRTSYISHQVLSSGLRLRALCWSSWTSNSLQSSTRLLIWLRQCLIPHATGNRSRLFTDYNLFGLCGNMMHHWCY